jgi:anti-sigma factor RsiW
MATERDPAARAEAYLEGDLPPAEALAFERELAEGGAASRALAEALEMRELLRSLPPVVPPPGLEERIAAALPTGPRRERRRADPAGAAGALRSALAGLSWAVRGPAGALGGAAPAASGISRVRWALGPLSAQLAPPPRPPLWRRLLGGRR